MRRSILTILIFVVTLGVGMVAPGRSNAQDAAEAVRNAERAFVAAIRSNGRRAMGRSLAAKFLFIEANGETRVKSAVMDHIALVAGRGENETGVVVRLYGQLAVVAGERGKIRFMRVWVKRRVGWLLFLMIETPLDARASPSPAAVRGDCDNPCRSIPYRPPTAQDARLAALWRDAQNAKWRGNADEFARFLAPEFVLSTQDGVADRDQVLSAVRTAGRPGTPGDPVTAMRIHGFDGGAIMIAWQRPTGGKPYVAVRVWAMRDGRFVMTADQRTTIAGAAAAPAAVRR